MAFRPLQDTQLSLGNLQEEINNLLGRIWHAGLSTRPLDGQPWAPVVDLHDRGEGYVLYAEIPGVAGGSVDVSYVGQTLTIRGEKLAPETSGEGNRTVYGERRFGAFCRTVELPSDADANKMTAQSGDGILTISIPKTEGSLPKVVKIKVAEG